MLPSSDVEVPAVIRPMGVIWSITRSWSCPPREAQVGVAAVPAVRRPRPRVVAGKGQRPALAVDLDQQRARARAGPVRRARGQRRSRASGSSVEKKAAGSTDTGVPSVLVRRSTDTASLAQPCGAIRSVTVSTYCWRSTPPGGLPKYSVARV